LRSAVDYNWFLPQLASAANGILSGLVSLAPHLFVELWQASLADDLKGDARGHERLPSDRSAIYGPLLLRTCTTRRRSPLKALAVITNADTAAS